MGIRGWISFQCPWPAAPKACLNAALLMNTRLECCKIQLSFYRKQVFNMICNWETTKMLRPFFSCYRHMWALKWSFCDSFCYIIGHISFFLGNWFCFHGMNVCICCYQNDSRFWRQEESHVLLIFLCALRLK